MKKFVMSGVAAALMAISSTTLAGDVAAGQAKAAACAGCHGANGISAVPTYPNLAGQKASYMAKQLHDFKSGARNDATMKAMAAPLSDADIENLAAYFESLK